jgi:hypothetical protein
VNSSNALLEIGLPPAIVNQPTNLAVAVGDVATFNIAAEGTLPLNYQWSYNGTNLLDATNSLLAITNVQLSDAGNYAVQVSNAFGSEASTNAVLSVGERPAIAVQPINQTIPLGGVATFEVAATGTPPLNYQWSRGGTILVDATNSLLMITDLQLSDSGLYSVAVSSSWGSALSSNATLLVFALDHFAWDTIPSPRFVNVPFSVRVRGLDSTNGLVTAFTGSIALTSTPVISFNPSVSGGFVLGEWTGSVTVSQTATGAVLVAADGSGHSGSANPINVVGLPAMSLERSGNSLVISWPAEASGFALETSADLSSWSPLTLPIFLIGTNYETRVPMSAVKSFYRLRFMGP